MERLGVVFSLLLLLCLCGRALGDIDCPSDSIFNSTSPQSPQTGFLEELSKIFLDCIKSSAGSDVTSPDAVCVALPEIRTCLAREETRWKQTYEGALNKVATIFRGPMEAFIDRLCLNDAEKLKALVHEFTALQKNKKYFNVRVNMNDFMLDCVFYGFWTIVAVDKSQADLSYRVWYFYYQARMFKECLIRTLSVYKDLVELMVEQIDPLLEDMRCLDPLNDDVVVPCKDVDTRLIDRAQLCPLKQIDPNQRFDELILRSIRCFNTENLATAESAEDYQEFFKNYCRRVERFNHCQCETSVAAEMCLNECNLKVLKLAQSNVNVAFETGCLGQGSHLAAIFARLHDIEIVSHDGIKMVTRCLNSTLVGESVSLDMYNYYRELPAIKQCILDGAPADTALKTAIDEVFDGISDKMNCFDPIDDKVVLCKTISDTNIH